MEKKITLDSKLKKYTALAGGLTMIAGAAQGQVYYTDINPDMAITGHQQGVGIDFNGDMNVDITLATIDTVTTGVYTYGSTPIPYTMTYRGAVGLTPGAGSNEGWMASATSGAPLANVTAGAAIGGAGTFGSGQGAIGNVISYYLGAPYNMSVGPYSSGMVGATDAYLGIKFDIAGAAHYGWVRVDLDATAQTLTVKDYAYDATAGTAINAGDMGNVGIAELENFATIVNTNDKVVISLNGANNEVEAIITNVSGQQVYAKGMNSRKEEIALDEFASGIYLVSVRSDKGIVTKRVYVK